MGLINLFRRPEDGETVTVDESAVTRLRVDGKTESVRWDDLREVSIITTDKGPAEEDLYFVLIGADGKSGCAVPQSAAGCDALLRRLQTLPGFDNEAAIKAMASTGNARFLLWKKS